MELNFVVSILDREREEEMTSLLRHCGAKLALTMLGSGTATREALAMLGLEETQKAVLCAVADAEQTRQIIKGAKRRLFIDIPGNGILLAVPVKSVGGGRTLAYLTDNAPKDASKPSMEFEHELIVVVLNEGHTAPVMDAARGAGAAGGTVLHAKGTGAQQAEKFLGVSLADEKEMIFIVSRSSEKGAIMKAIIEKCGAGTRAGAICFSLPISAVAGLRMLED